MIISFILNDDGDKNYPDTSFNVYKLSGRSFDSMTYTPCRDHPPVSSVEATSAKLFIFLLLSYNYEEVNSAYVLLCNIEYNYNYNKNNNRIIIYTTALVVLSYI